MASDPSTATAAGRSATADADDWADVCPLEDIPALGARVVRGATVDIAVFRTAEDRVFALLDRCPHRGGPLSQGIVYGHHVACPLHNWQIGLEDGEAQAPDTGCTRRFEVRVVDGLVQLRRQALLEDPAAPTVPTPAADAAAGAGAPPRSVIAIDVVTG